MRSDRVIHSQPLLQVGQSSQVWSNTLNLHFTQELVKKSSLHYHSLVVVDKMLHVGMVGGGRSGGHRPLLAVSADVGLRFKSGSIPWVESNCHFPKVLGTQLNSLYLKWIPLSDGVPEDFPARSTNTI